VIVLDTNVLSALMGNTPEETVTDWLDAQPRGIVWTTSLTVFEVRLGLLAMPPGHRRTSLAQDFDKCIETILQNRVLDFDQPAAEEAASLEASRRRTGRPHELRDSMIAGIAIAHRATLATRNTRHFADLPVPVIDPWQA
jgi:predicted nucleic acid-binding protein